MKIIKKKVLIFKLFVLNLFYFIRLNFEELEKKGTKRQVIYQSANIVLAVSDFYGESAKKRINLHIVGSWNYCRFSDCGLRILAIFLKVF